jgi:signal transduction histidine kinase
VEHFRPVRAWLRWIARGGLILSPLVLLTLDLAAAFPPLLALPIIVYFVYVEGYAAFAFVRGALTTAGVARWRLTLAAAGTSLLAAVILLAGINIVLPIAPGFRAVLGPAAAILSGLCYYFGFATPRWLRRAWQLAELYRFLHTASGPATSDQDVKVLDDLCAAATRGVGGVAAVVAVWDEADTRLKLRAPSTHPRLNDVSDLTAGDGILERVWREQRPVVALTPTELGPEAARLAAAVEAYTLYAVPIAAAQRLWGLLLVFRQGYPLFAADDLDLLALFAEQSAITLAYATLLNEQHRLIDELQQRTAQLEVANRELEAFSYSVSHDLRAPLRAIDGFSQALLDDYRDRLAGQGQDYLQRVQAATRRMAQLIDDLLRISRVTRAEMHREVVDLGALARHVANALQRAHPGRQVEFVIADGLSVEGDGPLLHLVLDNLLGNAWKFSSNQPQARIELGVMAQNGERVYFVRDDGAGFDMAYADKLFGAFQRLHTLAEFPGTGIGLATVQRIIHRHGGRVWAEGAVGRGATFYFTLP